MKKGLLFIVCVALMATAFAQKDVVGTPYTFNHNNVSMSIDQIDLPALDVDKLMAEDALTEKGTPLRIGTVQNVSYTFQNSGRTDRLADGSILWRLSIKSPGAVMLSVIFSQFNLPEGATFHIYNGDRTQLTGTYTNEDFLETDGLMASEDIMGDEAILEYYEPADALFHGNIKIERISQIYRDFLHLSSSPKGHWGDAEGNCHPNVNCPEGYGWRDQINSVVCISITDNTGSYLCSGAMINNVRQDKTPYVLTANHCFTGTTGGTFKFYFNYQTLTCEGSNGYFNRVANGATVIANAGLNSAMTNMSSSSDFLLLKITGALGALYRDSIVFAGWDATGTASVGSAIHHPGGDFKKISLPRQVTSPGGAYNKYWTVYWYTNPNKGCTEQGSSGSPLFNANGLIIGDLSSGSSSCDYPQGTDSYGKLSYSWTNNNNSNNARKLKPWLDPDNTGKLTMPGMRYNGSPAGIVNYNTTVRNLSISPNPSIGNITVQGGFESESGICNVYNAMGTLVFSQTIQLEKNMNLNLSHLSNGIYFVEIVNDNHIYKTKMVIAK
ncbi:MAG: T9SS type A sorting domain-containing protein [Bacteroidales bacterium]|nr:T9SS type A sorting domain-containing protein [Bacteroidales bacterium]